MSSVASHAKLVAALQTAGFCATVEAMLILVVGTLMNSYLGSVGVSLLILGPVSLWIAHPLYRRLLSTRT
ncbi:MAG: hypothetical protein K0S57_2645 [Ramlibacter sp.]|jgi:hypothetical protein|nr:hypothetical protein [Ramlibacter sp.]